MFLARPRNSNFQPRSRAPAVPLDPGYACAPSRASRGPSPPWGCSGRRSHESGSAAVWFRVMVRSYSHGMSSRDARVFPLFCAPMPRTLRALLVSCRELRRLAQRPQVRVTCGGPYARRRVTVWGLPLSHYYKHALLPSAMRSLK